MIKIDKNSPISINTQIVEQVKRLIFKEIWQSGDKLPSVRQLSADLVLNPNTIQKAYRELELLGYVETKAGKGVFVKSVESEEVKAYKVKLVKEFKAEVKNLVSLGVTKEELKEIIDGVI